MINKKNIKTDTSQLLAYIENNIGYIILNRPEALNALSDELTPALRRTISVYEEDNNVRVIAITGKGSSFCAGGDIKSMSQGGISKSNSIKKSVSELKLKQRTLTGAIYNSNKPTVAILSGVAAGAGLSLALSCDIRIASKQAFVTTGYGKIGLSGDYGISWLLVNIIGMAKTKELMFTSARVYASEALDLGIFNKVFSKESLEQESQKILKNIANGSPIANQAIKENIRLSAKLNFLELLDLEAENLIKTANTLDHKEGIRAFIEKREPNFTGS